MSNVTNRKIALVTGGTSGVGLSILPDLVQAGFYVYFVGTNADKGRSVESDLNSLNGGGLFLNSLDSVSALRRHVSFYITAHNTEVPHSAFRGQTPDEVYTETGERIAAELEMAKEKAREERLDRNRAMSCTGCSGRIEQADDARSAA